MEHMKNFKKLLIFWDKHLFKFIERDPTQEDNKDIKLSIKKKDLLPAPAGLHLANEYEKNGD